MNSIPINLTFILLITYIIGAFFLSNKFVKREKSVYFSIGWLYLYSIFFFLFFIGIAYINGNIKAQKAEKLCTLIIEDFKKDFLNSDFSKKIVIGNEELRIEDIIAKIKSGPYKIKFRDFFMEFGNIMY